MSSQKVLITGCDIRDMLATPLLLNSIWLLIPILLTVGWYVLRTSLKDRFLQEDLGGYQEYVIKVKYRLVPGI